MSRSAILAAAALLAGCATVYSPDQALQIARNSPDWELCYVAVSGRGQDSIRGAVYQVMRERSTNCNQHAAIVQAKLAQDAANSAAVSQTGLMLMQAGRAKPAPMPQPVYCRTVPVGGGFNTVCD